MSERFGVETSGSGQFGSGIKEPGNDHGNDKVPLGTGVGINDALEVQVSERPQDRGDMPMGARAHDVKGTVELLDGGATAQESLEALDEFGRPCREIGKGTFADCVTLAKGLAEQDGWG
jgi:hypothetical protein